MFAGTLSKLDQVELKDALITDQQLQALISRVKDTKTKLSTNLICETLKQPPVSLTSAFLHLHKLWLYLEDQTELSAVWRGVMGCLGSSRVMEELRDWDCVYSRLFRPFTASLALQETGRTICSHRLLAPFANGAGG